MVETGVEERGKGGEGAGIRSKEEGKLNIKFTLTKWVNIKMFKSM